MTGASAGRLCRKKGRAPTLSRILAQHLRPNAEYFGSDPEYGRQNFERCSQLPPSLLDETEKKVQKFPAGKVQPI